jgi:predicted ATP-grasp superfamily ATP-dependent carboligase
MEVADVLIWEGLSAPLRRPVMVLALTGWFDAAGVATAAIEHLIEHNAAEVVASIDCDPFYDFTQIRPEIRLDEDDERVIEWPTNEIIALRFPEFSRDIVVMSGVEPHIRWHTFVRCVVAASADTVPHTRTPFVVGSTVDPQLARTLGLSRPSYQGITGVVGVMQTEFEREELPAISLRVGVPHYLGNAEHPQASAALLRQLEHVLGVPTRHGELEEEMERWRSLHDDAVSEDDRALRYVQMLELEFDRRAEELIPSGDDLAAEFQKFLDDNRPD